MNKIFFISNSYRKTRILGFIDANFFGVFKLMGYAEPIKNKYWLLKRIYIEFYISISNIIVVSDVDGIEFLGSFAGLKNKKINLLMWNSVNELEKINVQEMKLKYDNLTICFFFKDSAKRAKELYQIDTKYLISPIVPYISKSSNVENRIIYCSEVDIFPKLSEFNTILDEKIWEYADKIVVEGSYLLYTSELVSAFFNNFEYNFDINWVLKNRVRYIYAKKLKEVFDEKFLLVGNDWINLGFDAIPSNYEIQSLYELYSCSKVCIDLLSKSSNEALFERVIQIISASNGLIQVKTTDSEEVYGDYFKERTFDTISNLIIKINSTFSLNENEFRERGESFRKYIKQKSTSFFSNVIFKKT